MTSAETLPTIHLELRCPASEEDVATLRERIAETAPGEELVVVVSGTFLPPREALQLIETVLSSRSRVSIHGEGRVEGAVLILLACGAPGKRSLAPNARLRLRAPSELVPTGFAPVVDLEAAARLRASLLEHLAEATGMELARAFDDSLAEKRLSPRQAVNLGFADRLDPDTTDDRLRPALGFLGKAVLSVLLAAMIALGGWALKNNLSGEFSEKTLLALGGEYRIFTKVLGTGFKHYLANATHSFFSRLLVGLGGFFAVYSGFNVAPRKSFVVPWFLGALATALVFWTAKAANVSGSATIDAFDVATGALLAAIPAHRKLLELGDQRRDG